MAVTLAVLGWLGDVFSGCGGVWRGSGVDTMERERRVAAAGPSGSTNSSTSAVSAPRRRFASRASGGGAANAFGRASPHFYHTPLFLGEEGGVGDKAGRTSVEAPTSSSFGANYRGS